MVIGAALWRNSNNKIYLFEDAHYFRISRPGQGVDAGYPEYISERWPGVVEAFNYGKISAALMRNNGKIYLFSGDSYIRYSRIADGIDEGYPKRIADHWPGLPSHFAEGIDAAVVRGNGKIYFFKGHEYVRFTNPSQGVDSGYPKRIDEAWPGLPYAFDRGINAALLHKKTRKLYLFADDEYVRFSDAKVAAGPDDGYPKKIAGAWTPIYPDAGGSS